MHRDDGKVHGRWLRRTLGRLTGRAIRQLSVVSRRLGYPALATIPVSAAMLSRLDVVTPQQSLEDVAQLFIGGRNSQLPVIEHGLPVAVVTRDDVARGLEIGGPHAAVSEAPQHNVVTVTPSDSLVDVMEQLRLAPDSVAVVVDHGAPVGLLTFDGLAAYLRGEKLA